MMNETTLDGGLAQRVKYYVTLPSYKTSHGFPERLPAYDNGKPMPFSTDELALKINWAFAEDSKVLRSEYFARGSEINGDLAFLVLGLDEAKSYDLAEGLIAKEIELNGVKIVVYDIIFVTPPYRRQGHMPKMICIANQVKPDDKGNKQPSVAILRTKKDYAHKQYKKISDINDSDVDELGGKMSGFKIHGFDFFNKDGSPNFDNAQALFVESALYLASRPENFYLIQ